METAIGVFTSRDHAEEAVKELRERGVPQESIVFLTLLRFARFSGKLNHVE